MAGQQPEPRRNSIYFGWITVATIANVTALLVAALWMLFNRRDLFFALVANWAVLGILMKRAGDTRTPAPGVVLASISCLSAMTLAIIIQIVRGRVYH
ncbi:MAG: hypothetical protein A2V99_06010 [Spirochaetes bacterium RBG_16_67_19]|nr:MAG: hypothetical protein A2V99_06010 [Spirochaetes bacterium RBG_16_67_19]